ncbi:amidohydrolase, partial [Dethiosulfatibacter aminovorans DSM 17477]
MKILHEVLNDEIRKRIEDEIINIRRDIHEYPELGFNEVRTASIVVEKLKELGIEVHSNIAKTGVVGLLKGKHQGKTILLRADMDALAMEELNDIPYKSKNEGIMHGCGHDAHTAWLLGAAMVLAKFKDELYGNVKFLFQPAEET